MSCEWCSSSECDLVLWAVVFRCRTEGKVSVRGGRIGKGWVQSGLRTYGLDGSLGQGGRRSSLG